MAGFEVITYGRFWVTAEVENTYGPKMKTSPGGEVFTGQERGAVSVDVRLVGAFVK